MKHYGRRRGLSHGNVVVLVQCDDAPEVFALRQARAGAVAAPLVVPEAFVVCMQNNGHALDGMHSWYSCAAHQVCITCFTNLSLRPSQVPFRACRPASWCASSKTKYFMHCQVAIPAGRASLLTQLHAGGSTRNSGPDGCCRGLPKVKLGHVPFMLTKTSVSMFRSSNTEYSPVSQSSGKSSLQLLSRLGHRPCRVKPYDLQAPHAVLQI